MGLDDLSGMRDADQKITYYEVLELSEKASAEEIKQAYRSHIKEWHPDINPDKPGASAMTQAINEAYGVLSDPLLKAQYDDYLSLTRAKDTFFDPADEPEMDYSNMSFEDYVENVTGESYSAYRDSFNEEPHKFDEAGYREYVKNKGSVMDRKVDKPAIILIGFACVLVSTLFLNRRFLFPDSDIKPSTVLPLALVFVGLIGAVLEIRRRNEAARKEREKRMSGNESILEADKWFDVWLYPEMPLAECRKVFFDFSVNVDKHILSRFNAMSDGEKEMYADIIELLQESIKYRERK